MDKQKKQMIIGAMIMSILPAGFAIGGAVSMTIVGLSDGLLAALFPAVFALFGVGFLVLIWRTSHQSYVSKKHRLDYDFDWYRTTYPSHFRNGRVSCQKCGCNQIHVRALMGRTYSRAHFCVRCGETLYYSPEKLTVA